MLKKLYKVTPILYALPLVAGAQTIGQILSNLRTTFNTVIGILFVLATLVFLWGLVKFVASADSPDKRNEARGLMLWGIVALAVMAAAWGIVQVLVNYFGVGGVGIPPGPGGLTP